MCVGMHYCGVKFSQNNCESSESIAGATIVSFFWPVFFHVLSIFSVYFVFFLKNIQNSKLVN